MKKHTPLINQLIADKNEGKQSPTPGIKETVKSDKPHVPLIHQLMAEQNNADQKPKQKPR